MTAILELDNSQKFLDLTDDIEPIVYNARWKWENELKINLRAYDKEYDLIYSTSLEVQREMKESEKVKKELSGRQRGKFEVRYNIETIGEIIREHQVDGRGKITKGTKGFEEQERKKVLDAIREQFNDKEFVEGEIRGSAKDVFVEVDG